MSNLFKNKKGMWDKIIILMIILFVVMIIWSSFSKNSDALKNLDAAQIHYSNNCEIMDKDCNKVILNCFDENIKCTFTDQEIMNQYLSLKDCDYYEDSCSKEEKNEWNLFKGDLALSKSKDEIVAEEYIPPTSEIISEEKFQSLSTKDFKIKDYDKTPYGMTAKGETGSSNNPLETVKQIVIDTGGTNSYGNFGLNSKGGAISFWKNEKDCLQLKGTPGDNNGKESWNNIAENYPEDLVIAEINWYNNYIINPVINTLIKNGFSENYYNNPSIIAYFSDVTIQEGSSSMKNLITKIQPDEGENQNDYLDRVAGYQSSDDYLKVKFKTYLSEHPEALNGLKSRILNKRLPLSKEIKIVMFDVNKQCVLS